MYIYIYTYMAFVGSISQQCLGMQLYWYKVGPQTIAKLV